MEINKDCKLISSDCYVYDIVACHHTILKKLGCNISQIEEKNKTERNIQIGKLMRDNPRLTSILRKTTNTLVDEFILRNNISNDEIINRSYDGIVITKPVNNLIYNEDDITLDLRDIYQKFIISLHRNSYIALNNSDKIIIKGISNRYEAMSHYYSRLLNINFLNKSSIFVSLQNIKDEIVNSDDSELFCIPIGDNKYEIYLVRYNKIIISGTIIRMLDTDDIDKEFYFNKYLEPFFKSVVVEYI